MEYKAEKFLSGIAPLLERLDRGEALTTEEHAELAAIRKLYVLAWEGELPRSISTLTALEHLNLSGTQVCDLTPLSGLTALQELNLNETQVCDLTPLSGLTALQELNLIGTQICDISPLSGLKALRELDLGETQVRDLTPLRGLTALDTLNLAGIQVRDLSPLSGLTALETLFLFENQAQDLTSLGNLTTLEVLVLGGSQIQDLTPLRSLTALQQLYLIETQVCDLSPLSGMTALRELSLTQMQIRDLTPLCGLEHLEMLDLTGCSLRAIPRPIYERLGKDGIRLDGATLSTQPISIFQEDDAVIRAYYDEPKVPVREAKVIFLGDGGAGKTHTIKRIRNAGSDADIDTDVTLGISIDRHEVKGRGFHINFWDFGGQENMHAMHRCFLTERTLYVVVLNSRWDLDDQARRWLDNIRAFAPDSPVILAVNLWEGVHRYAMDTGRILKEYPNVIIQTYTAKGPDKGEFQALTKLIEREAEKLDSCAMELPVRWAAILEELRELAERRPVPGEKFQGHIDRADYLALCDKHGLGGEENEAIRTWLLEWFNDLGVCFSYHRDRETRRELDEYKVLNPRWLTGAIYYLINQKDDIGENGHVTHYSIRKLLKYPDPEELREGWDRDYILPNVRYTPEECRYILQVMRKFGLSYEIEGKELEFIPALCASATPEDLHPESWQECVSYEFRYSFLPDSVVQRLMVRLRKNWQFTMLWRRGFRYDDPHNGLITVADAGGGRDRLRLHVYSTKENPGWDVMLSLISRIAAINTELNLKPEEYVIVRGDRGEIAAPADMILQAKEQGVPRLHLYSRENGLVERDVDQILGGTYSPQIIHTAAAAARADDRSLTEMMPQVIHNYTIYGDVVNNAPPEQLLALLERMVEQNAAISDRFVELCLEQLGSNKKLTEDVKKAEKGGALKALWKGVKSLPKVAAGAKSTLEDSKAAADIVKAALVAYGPQIFEGTQNLLELLQGLGG